MSNHSGLQSILGLEFYKKQKDWKFERQKSTFDFNADPEYSHQRQVSVRPTSFIRGFTSADEEQYRGKITRKKSLDSSKTDHKNRRSHFNSSMSSNKSNKNLSNNYCCQTASPNESFMSDNNRFDNNGSVTKIGCSRNTSLAQYKFDLNKTYGFKKYFDFDIYCDETMICDDNIDGQIDTKKEPIELNTTFNKEIKESVVVLDVLSGSMQANMTEPYIEDPASEEQFFIGASKKFHSSALDLPTWEPEIPSCGFRDVDEKGVTNFTRPMYSVLDEEELERMRKMSYKELMSEIVLEHIQMQQHEKKKKNLMEAMVNKIEFDTVEDKKMHQDFNYANVDRAEVLRKRKNNNYRCIAGSRTSSVDSERFSRCTTIPLVWNL